MNRYGRIEEKIVADMRIPTCANCGKKIPVWANPQGKIPSTTISMFLCRDKKCNSEAVADVKQYLT